MLNYPVFFLSFFFIRMQVYTKHVSEDKTRGMQQCLSRNVVDLCRCRGKGKGRCRAGQGRWPQRDLLLVAGQTAWVTVVLFVPFFVVLYHLLFFVFLLVFPFLLFILLCFVLLVFFALFCLFFFSCFVFCFLCFCLLIAICLFCFSSIHQACVLVHFLFSS